MKIRIFIGGLILCVLVFFGVFGSFLTPHAPDEINLLKRLLGPTLEHPMGFDLYGADILSIMIAGAGTTLWISSLSLIASASIGISIGLIAGMRGGVLDFLLMRLVDILMAFPGTLLALTLAAVLGPGLMNIVLAISITGWIGVARLVRGQVLSLKERDFTYAAKVLGISSFRMAWKYYLPLLIPQLLVHLTFSLSGVILVESSLSFLGLGPQGKVPTWGGLLSQGKSVLGIADHIAFFSGGVIFITILGINFLGDGLRDYLDPRYNK